MATIKGTSGNDVLTGTDRKDRIFGKAGDDVIDGAGGNDKIYGGAGNDVIDGGAGKDKIDGGAGDDVISGGDGADKLKGGTGNDTISGDAGNDKITGGAGDDTLSGGTGNDKISSGAGNDDIEGGAGDDWINGNAGDDTIDGGAGDDDILGGTGNDTIAGGGGDDWIHGQSGDDVIDGGADADRLWGGNGDDTIADDAGADWLKGQSGDDELAGGSGADRISGGAGDDVLTGGTGNDVLFGDGSGSGSGSGWHGSGTGGGGSLGFGSGSGGGSGTGGSAGAPASFNDILEGGAGDDLLVGGVGDDVLTGGAGNDSLYGDFLRHGSGSGSGSRGGTGTGQGWHHGSGSGSHGTGTGSGGDPTLTFNDYLDGGAGDDVVFGQLGDDTGVYAMQENLGATDHYDGGVGFDTIVFRFTYGEFADAGVQADLAAFDAFLAAFSDRLTRSGPTFQFTAFDLAARNWEDYEIELVNTAPVANADSAATDEDTAVGGNVLANDTDVDALDVLTVVGFDATSALGAGVAVDAAGNFTYDPSAAPALQALAVDESTVDTFSYAIADLAGATATATVAVTVAGVNDAPVITSGVQGGGAAERADGAPDENAAPDHEVDGTISFDDVDLTDTHTVTVTEQGGGYRGSLATVLTDSTGTGSGAVAWTFTIVDAALDDLGAGDVLTQGYEVKVDDGKGGIATEIVALTLTGTNDASDHYVWPAGRQRHRTRRRRAGRECRTRPRRQRHDQLRRR